MPIQWLGQPWMYGTIFSDPTYLVAVLVLPIAALFLGPLFCGWMCPAGQMTEFLSRVVPPRFQINLIGKVNPVPVRLGFMVGMMGVAYVGGNACCSFCNFTHTQNIINAGFGNFLGITYLASFTIVSFMLWFFVMGLFTRGGRGWCNFLCPAGALMGLTHRLGVKLKISRQVKIDRGDLHQLQELRLDVSCLGHLDGQAKAGRDQLPGLQHLPGLHQGLSDELNPVWGPSQRGNAVKTPFHTRIQQVQPKLHGMAVGMTIAIGSTFLTQGCPLIGQCATCAACAPRLPLLALPLAADAVVMLAGRIMGGRSNSAPPASLDVDSTASSS